MNMENPQNYDVEINPLIIVQLTGKGSVLSGPSRSWRDPEQTNSAEPKHKFFQNAVPFVFGWFSFLLPGEIIRIFASKHPSHHSRYIRNINKPWVDTIFLRRHVFSGGLPTNYETSATVLRKLNCLLWVTLSLKMPFFLAGLDAIFSFIS